MGQPSIFPQRLPCVPLCIAVLLVLAAAFIARAQTPIAALAVPLLLPSATVFDSGGNLYVAETSNHMIRKVDTSGVITTIAGTGAQGFSGDNGLAAAATLDSPQGLALDSGGNLYIADTHNHRIRRLTVATGFISTIAGSGAAGFSGDNGPALTAELDLPTALVLDPANNLYFADTANHRIRRIDAVTGVLTTLAGNGTQGFAGDSGPATSASIDSPAGLAISAGNLYLADTHNHRVRKIALSTGIITSLAGDGTEGFSGDGALASEASLALPRGLTADTVGNLYLADAENHRIRRIDAATGIILTVAGNGTQAFSGDGGPAISAALDSPSAVALPASNLLTLADTANGRIRQLDTAPAPGPDIHTLGGLGIMLPAVLTLSTPPAIVYGSGQILAALTTSSLATGSIVFVNTADLSTLGTAPLAGDSAAFSIRTLPAGEYSVSATYPGDQTHLSVTSPAISFKVFPQTLTASIASFTLTYGQPIPSLTGAVTGVLPQDTGNVSASFLTTASALSPGGAYPITVLLTGPAAGNYIVAAPAATITIRAASTSTSFRTLLGTAAAGSALSFTIDVAGTTPGVASSGPFTGTVTLLDGGAPLGTVPVSFGGLASFSNISLSPGIHMLTAVYSGSSNFGSSTSAPQQIVVAGGPGSGPNPAPPTSPAPAPDPAPSSDFTMVSAGPSSQTILSGTAANFMFTIQPQGSTSSPVSLAATGLPNLASASFNPPTVPPGSTANTFTLTIATPQTVATGTLMKTIWAACFLPILGLGLSTRHRSVPQVRFLLAALLGVALLAVSGCGNRVNTASAAAVAASKSYTITVTGTATSSSGAILQHSANVTLVVEPAS